MADLKLLVEFRNLTVILRRYRRYYVLSEISTLLENGTHRFSINQCSFITLT